MKVIFQIGQTDDAREREPTAAGQRGWRGSLQLEAEQEGVGINGPTEKEVIAVI